MSLESRHTDSIAADRERMDQHRQTLRLMDQLKRMDALQLDAAERAIERILHPHSEDAGQVWTPWGMQEARTSPPEGQVALGLGGGSGEAASRSTGEKADSLTGTTPLELDRPWQDSGAEGSL